MAGSLSGFDAADFRTQLRTAMGIGRPVVAPAFHFAPAVSTTASHDPERVPFDVDAAVTRSTPTVVSVPCALQGTDELGTATNLGVVPGSWLTVTLLDEDYAKVKGFAYVVVGGVIYDYQRTGVPQALGPVEVWTVHCQARDVA